LKGGDEMGYSMEIYIFDEKKAKTLQKSEIPNENFIGEIKKLDGTKFIDVYEFNHFEYNYFFDSLEGAAQGKKPEGFSLLESFLKTKPKTIYGMVVNEGEPLGIQNYVSSIQVKKEGSAALKLLENLKLDKDDQHLFPEGDGNEAEVERYASAKKKIVDALHYALEKDYGLIVCTF
jgi:hypothetical protein